MTTIESKLTEMPETLILRPYQAEAWEELRHLRQQGRKRALVHLATGLGKTALATTDALSYREEHPGSKILFVSHMNDINAQAAKTFKQVMLGFDYPAAPVVFATFQSLYRRLNQFSPTEFDYIVWDEAHHIEATTFKAVREHFQPKFELGLTATPTRADGLDILEYFGQPVFVKGLAEGVAEGWLSAVDYHIVLDDMVKNAVKEGFSLKSVEDIRQLFSIRVRNEVIAENVLAKRHTIGLDTAKTIVFCQNRQAAEAMARLLNGQSYHSGMYAERRRETMENFRSGKLQIICTVDMFNEGIDIPDAKLVVFLRSTSSRTIFEQQLGRGLRRSTDKDQVVVLDFVANVERIDFVRDLGHSISQERARLQGTKRERTDSEFIGPTRFQTNIDDQKYFASNFIFEDSTVELLDRFKQLSRPLPKGYITTTELEKITGVGSHSLKSYCEQIGMQIETYRSHKHLNVWGWSPKQVKTMMDHFRSLTENGQLDLISLSEVAKRLAVHSTTAMKLCQEAGVKLTNYRHNRSGLKSKGLMPSEWKKLENYVSTILPPEAINSTQLMKVLRLHTKGGITSICKKLNISPIKWGKHNYFTPEMVAKIKAGHTPRATKRSSPHSTEEVIEAYQKYGSITKTAQKLQVRKATVAYHIRKIGVKLSTNGPSNLLKLDNILEEEKPDVADL